MFERIKLFFQLFRQGQQVLDRKFWGRQLAYVQPVVAGLFLAVIQLAKSYGVELPLDYDTCMSIAAGIYFIVQSVTAIISNKHIGLPAGSVGEAQPPLQSPPDAPESPPVPSEPVSQDSSRFNEDTIRRAREWLERNGVDGKPVPEGQTNVFNTMG